MMKFNKRFVALIAVVVLMVGALAGGMLLAGEPLDAFAGQVLSDEAEDAAEGPDEAITGDALQEASNAALQYAGANGMDGARVTDTEVGDEEGYYEIELTLENGQQVDVHLDEAFEVLGQVEDVE